MIYDGPYVLSLGLLLGRESDGSAIWRNEPKREVLYPSGMEPYLMALSGVNRRDDIVSILSAEGDGEEGLAELVEGGLCIELAADPAVAVDALAGLRLIPLSTVEGVEVDDAGHHLIASKSVVTGLVSPVRWPVSAALEDLRRDLAQFARFAATDSGLTLAELLGELLRQIDSVVGNRTAYVGRAVAGE